MYGQHSAIQERTVFFSDSFVLILRVYVLKYLFGSQRFTIPVVAFHPEPRRVVVVIIRDVNVIFAEIFFFLLIVAFAFNLDKAVFVFLRRLAYLLLCKLMDAVN